MRLKAKFNTLLYISLAVIVLLGGVNLYVFGYFSSKISEVDRVAQLIEFSTRLKDLLYRHNQNLIIYRTLYSVDLKETIAREVFQITDTIEKEGLAIAPDNKALLAINSQWLNYKKAITLLIGTDNTSASVRKLLSKDIEVLGSIQKRVDLFWQQSIERMKTVSNELMELKIIIQLLLVISFVSFIALILFFRRGFVIWMMQPLMEINRVGNLMADGDFDSRINVDRTDEIGEIARNFNTLADTLKEKVSTLQDSVKREHRVVRELTILSEFIGYISSEIEMDTLFERFAERTRDLLKAEHSFFVIVQDGNIRVFGTHQAISLESLCMMLGVDDIQQLLNEEFFRVNRHVDIEIDGLKVRDVIAITVSSNVGLKGLIVLVNKEGGFTQEDEDSLFSFAFQAFHAISLHSELTRLATTDGLTGLYNHRMFQERLTEELIRAKRYKRKLFILMIDIDHFKKFNDTYGHQAGDEVLKTVARIIKENTRSIDCAARYGGEEFVIILPETDCNDAYNVAERLRKKIQQHRFVLSDGTEVAVTVSIGIACFPDDSTDKDELIKKADMALYEAKRRGRNTTVLFREIKNEGLSAETDNKI